MIRGVNTSGFLKRQLFGLAAAGLLCALAGLSPARAESGDYIHYRLGVKYKNEHKYDQALEEFRRVLAAYPDNYNAYMNIAEIQIEQKQGRLAIYNLKKALTYNPGWSKAHRLLAEMYEADHQLQSAIKEWQEYQQVCDPAEAQSVQARIDLLLKGGRRAGDPASARTDSTRQAAADSARTPAGEKAAAKPATSHRRTVSRPPSSSPPQVNEEFKRAVQLYDEGVNGQETLKFEEALESLRKVLALQPSHAGAYYYAGLIRRRFGQNQMAKVNFEKAFGYPELGYNAHFYLGKIYGEEKNYSRAIQHLKEYAAATEYAAGKREAHNLIGRYEALLQAQKADTVKVDIAAIGQQALHEEISKIPPEAKLSQFEVRIDSLLALVVVDTLTDAGQAMLKGVRLFGENKFEAAVEKFKEVQTAYPRGDVAAHTLYDLGVCYLKLRDFSSAEKMFQQVISRFGSKSVAIKSLFLKALANFERHDFKTSEMLLRQFIQNNRNHAWAGKAYEKLGDGFVRQEQHSKAIDAFSQAVAKARSPLDKVHALFKQGLAYQALDNQPKAQSAFKAVISEGERAGIAERVPDAYYKMADHLYKKGDLRASLDYYVSASRKYPAFSDTPWALFQIAGIYKKEKRFDKAITTYNELLERFPDSYWARQAQWKKEDTVWENEYGAVLH